MTPPVTNSYESIFTTTLTGSQSDITFSSIPSTYKHLQIRGTILNANGNNNLALRFNGSSASDYSAHQLQGSGASATANDGANLSSAGYGGLVIASSSYPFVGIYDILDYADTNKYKTLRSLSGQDGNATGTATDWRVQLGSGSWRSTSAINSITILLPSLTMGQYSSFALYGIKG